MGKGKVFGQRVAARRVLLGLSQAQLGDRLGLSESSVSRIESGHQGYPASDVPQLAKALECAPVDLYPPSTKAAG